MGRPPNLIKSRLVWPLSYRLLVSTSKLADNPFVGRVWRRLWKHVSEYATGSARVTIHGRAAMVNVGNTYPIYSRRFPMLNSPLVELVHECYLTCQREVILVDVGAATGDTILLLQAKCPRMIGDFYCIDGDTEFFDYLEQNVGSLPGSHLIRAMLSSSETAERDLVRTHGGTASAQGTEIVSATTLDAICATLALESVDVLKIDVDGFDGKVLLGSRQVLKRFRPYVIFEWHPILCYETGSNYTDHFQALAASNYDQLIWFDKFGNFSHFSTLPSQDTNTLLARYCLEDKVHDRHFDVIALPTGSKIDPVSVARLKYSRSHP